MYKYRASKRSAKFCKHNCNVVAPKKENTIYFDSTYQALLNSYLPCNVCKPLIITNKTNKYIKDLIKEVIKSPYKIITKKDVLLKGINFDDVDRWFKKYHRFSFLDFQRILLLNTAFNDIYRSKNIKLSMDLNFDFRNVFGDIQTSGNNIVNIELLKTPIGPMYCCSDRNGIILLEFSNQKKIISDIRKIVTTTKSAIRVGENDNISDLKLQLAEYFDGKRKEFDLKFSQIGTEFQKSVWNIISDIKYGENITYLNIASRLNNAKAVRAVASAIAANQLRIVVPCHRIVGSNGKMVGYGGGLDRKRWLIDFENYNCGKTVQKSIEFFF